MNYLAIAHICRKVTSALLGCHARGIFGDWTDMQGRALLPEHRRQFEKKRTGEKKEKGEACSSGRVDVYSEDQQMNV